MRARMLAGSIAGQRKDGTRPAHQDIILSLGNCGAENTEKESQ